MYEMSSARNACILTFRNVVKAPMFMKWCTRSQFDNINAF